MSKLIKRKQIDLKLKSSPDGTYGFSSNIPNVLQGDDLESALDKIVSVLDKLAPALPPFLNTLTLTESIAGGTTAATTGLLTTDGTSKTNIHKFANGATLTWTTTGVANGVATRDGHFRDGSSTTAKLRITHTYNSTTKQATISNINAISIAGTANAIDSTNYTVRVDILTKLDYYSSDAAAATKSNFYTSIKGAILATMATTTNAADALERTVLIEYSENGTFSDTISLTSTYRIEGATAPTSNTPTLTIPAMTGFVSGVPSLSTGQTLTVASTISNAIKYYYPSQPGTSTATATGGQVNTISGVQTANSTYSYSATHTVLASQYSESIAASVTPRDIFALGSVANATTDTTKRVDTTSIAKASTDAATRKLSPITSSQYEAISATAYGTAGHVNSLVSGSYIYQLQLLNGAYRYPTVNYTAYGGPNYTSQTGYRYVDFAVTSITNKTNVLLTVVGATGIAEKFGTANFRLYIKVEGSTGWLDANAAWSSGTPSADGAAAVDAGAVATTTTGVRQITFGATLSGNISVRVGINNGSAITFTGITVA